MATAQTTISALDALLNDIAGAKIDAATRAKIALYSGIVGGLLDEALPVIDAKLNWSGIEAGLSQSITGIEATFDAFKTPDVTSETAANA